MDKFDTRRVAEGLTAYAIERKNGWERHQREGAPTWMEQRRFWTDAILQGMAKLDGRQPDPALMERFDRELERAGSNAATVPASPELQRDTIRALSSFVSVLEADGNDRRRQADMVRELLEDMATHLPWAGADNGLDHARDQVDRALAHMTARMPIRFTRVLLGSDAGPHWVSGFAPGVVTNAEAVKGTAVYQDAVRDYPEVKDWPTLCTVYLCGKSLGASTFKNAGELDMKVIRDAGDRFLKLSDVRPVISQPLSISVYEQIRALKIEPGRAPEEITVPNTLEAFQAAVGGDIEAVGLDGGACLICNELGKLTGLPANRRVGGDIIAGTFLIVGCADSDFCSLSDDAAAHYAEHFAEPISEPCPEGLREFTFYIM